VKALPKEIDEQTVIKIGKDLCSALVLCKKHGIIHRDIKPQNIFVSDNGEYKLGDFGIAKTVEKTMAGTMIGTYKYMAPEVYNNQAYGSAADICSLGLVLYWLLNERRMPFVPLPPARLTMGIDEAARIRRLRGEPIPAPAHGSDELKEIVLKACEYMPDRRFSSGAEMLEALTALSTGQYHAAAPKVADPQSAPIPEPSPVEAPEIAADADDDRTVSIFGRDRQQAGETAAEETVVPPKDIDIQTNAAAPAEKPSDRKLSAQDAQEALLSLIQEMDAYENPSEKAKKKSDKRIAQKGDDFVELLRLFRNG
jgi:serine/threonine protein kinase